MANSARKQQPLHRIRQDQVTAVETGGGRAVSFSRELTFVVLFFLFLLTFLLTPLWKLPVAMPMRFGLAVALVGIGIGWAYAAAGQFRLDVSNRLLPWLLVGLGILGVLNWRAITYDVPWQGDEDYHIQVILGLAGTLRSYWYFFAVALAPIVVLAVRNRRALGSGIIRKGLILVQLLVAGLVIVGLSYTKSAYTFHVGPDQFHLARYPWLSEWLATIPVVLLHLVHPGFVEASFRVVPFVSAVLLVVYCARRSGSIPWWGMILYMVSLATIPLIFYHSSIQFLEMPAIFLMTVVCLNVEELLDATISELFEKPSWYALLLIGFIKESLVPFLAVFLVCRLVVQLRREYSRKGWMGIVAQEARIAYCVLAPVATYLVCRLYVAGGERAYVPTWQFLSSMDTYRILLRASWEQFGVGVLLFLLGLAFYWRQRRLKALMFHVAACGALLVFLLGDAWGWMFLCHSRFMLLLVPLIISAQREVVVAAYSRSRVVAGLMLLVVIGGNLLMSPVNLDGAKKTGWGNYRIRVIECYYPFRTALRYVQQRYPTDRTLFSGIFAPYHYEWYTGQTDRFAQLLVSLVPPIYENILPEEQLCSRELQAVAKVLAVARQNNFQHVLYVVRGSVIPRPIDTSGYTLERTFTNSVHALLLFSMNPNP
jgi:hypothetical protein